MSRTLASSPEARLRHIHLLLAREPGHPDGSSREGYELIAPLDAEGHLDETAWRSLKDKCRVKRFAEQEADQIGHIVRKPGGHWAFHYDIHGSIENDETGYRLASHRFVPGEYVSIKERDGELKTFRVAAVLELE
ncbi:MAG: hypothetical protein NW216_03355 [Hyphomicrobium sp.]|nr:hypothetical protein [Hyphomicrobium sp.]